MATLKDLTGQTFGTLIVIERTGRINVKRQAFWKCKCGCGRIIEVRGDNLRAGKSTKCCVCNRNAGWGSRELL